VEGEVWSVHVAPAETAEQAWEVTVGEANALRAAGNEATPAVRNDHEFYALDTVLHGAGISALPILHLGRRSLIESRDDKQAEHLQQYLAQIVGHVEARQHAAFLKFIAPAAPAETTAEKPTEPPPIRRESSSAAPTIVSTPVVACKRPDDAPAEPTCSKVKLSWTDEKGEHECELPVLSPSHGMGNRVIDVGKLGALTGFFTHDPGFTSTSSCQSAITYIDGEKGVLLHRGYAIADLARGCSFPEVAYLLIEGELPTATEAARFEAELKKQWMVHEKLVQFFNGFKSDAHPMAIMVGVVGALSAFYPEAQDIQSASGRRLSAIRLIAKIPTIAAITYKTSVGQPVVYPRESLSFATNFLHMMFATPCAPYEVHPVHAAALETILVLHADHEQNASTSTVRIASSSQANPFACIAAGIASLWGPAHGGANEAVLRMLDEIGTADRIPLYLAKAKDKSDPFRLMGFGHRVYKNFDPRAQLMRGICADVLSTLPTPSAQLELAQKLEAAALADEYFVQRKLYPNVDFYSGIVLAAIGIPRDMFTVIFAVARCVGWLAQWNESFADAQHRISRPRQLYVGAAQREFVPKGARGNGGE